MKLKKQSYRNYIIVIFAVFIMVTALFSCFIMIQDINQRMNDSADSNLLNTTTVIKDTLENYIEQDFDTLGIVGELYQNGKQLDGEQIKTLCGVMGFEWIGITDSSGNGIDLYGEKFQAGSIPDFTEGNTGEKGYSQAYFGNAGRLQTTLWRPVFQDGVQTGTVFGEVILSKYYSANVFTFYEGEGRTYLFDGSEGTWVLRSLGTDGASSRQDDIYSLLLSTGNRAEDVEAFRQAVADRQTGTAVFDFNGRQSYICFMPLPSSADWFLATVIADEVLLKESAQVQQTIRLVVVILCATLLFLTVLFVVWRVRRIREQEAAYREALFINVSSNIDSAFLIYEKSSQKTVFVSENVGRLLNLNRKQLRSDAGKLFDWCGLSTEDPQVCAFLKGELDEPAVREVCVEDVIGARNRYVRLELIPADMGQEIAVVTDITKDKDVQQSLLEAMQRSEAASNAKNEFLSAMSHDIRTPINGIVGMTAIAAANLGDRDRVCDCLGKISDASAHLLTIINEVLDMSYIESGKLELAHEPFNVAELLQEVLNLNYPGIQQKNHTIQVHIHSMDHEQVIGDSLRLQRITSNLISNAIKYTPEGGRITLELREKEPMIAGYGCYELTVKDNGIGMSPEFQKKLFAPFEREEDVRISKIQGTGLGMSIVKNIVSLMMGDIQVESRKNEGTEFRVTVNLQLHGQDSRPSTVLASLPVLVVDDDQVTCETVTGILCDIGMAGEWVDNGAEAVRKVSERHSRNEDYMAVLLDWKMPGMDGIETARQIRTRVGANLPVIILTAYDWSEIEAQAKEAGVDAFLSKPIYKAKLRQKLEEFADPPAEPQRVFDQAAGHEIPEGKRVLLVEDNELNLEIAAELLQMLKLQVDTAEDGAAAVKRFAESRPGTYDLILMDIQMPRMNGYEAARAIRRMDRQDSRTVPVIAMTADTFAKDVQAAYAAGMNEHLAKPVSIERLIQVLSAFLSNQEKEEQTGGDLGNEKQV